MRLDLIDRPYVYFIALLIVAWLTSGAMAVRSVSRIWLRHWRPTPAKPRSSANCRA